MRSLQQLFRWLTDEGGIARSAMERMSPPAVQEQPVPILGDDVLTALLACCRANTFETCRDTAIIRLLVDGMRAGELSGPGLDDVDFDHQMTHVLGKVAVTGPAPSARRPPTRYVASSMYSRSVDTNTSRSDSASTAGSIDFERAAGKHDPDLLLPTSRIRPSSADEHAVWRISMQRRNALKRRAGARCARCRIMLRGWRQLPRKISVIEGERAAVLSRHRAR